MLGLDPSSHRGPTAAFFQKPVVQRPGAKKVSRPVPAISTTDPTKQTKTQRSPSTAKTPIGNKKKTCLFPPQDEPKKSLLDEYKARRPTAPTSKVAQASQRLSSQESRPPPSMDESVVHGVQALRIQCDGGPPPPPPVRMPSLPPPCVPSPAADAFSFFIPEEEEEAEEDALDAQVVWKEPDMWERYLAMKAQEERDRLEGKVATPRPPIKLNLSSRKKTSDHHLSTMSPLTPETPVDEGRPPAMASHSPTMSVGRAKGHMVPPLALVAEEGEEEESTRVSRPRQTSRRLTAELTSLRDTIQQVAANHRKRQQSRHVSPTKAVQKEEDDFPDLYEADLVELMGLSQSQPGDTVKAQPETDDIWSEYGADHDIVAAASQGTCT